MRRISMINDQSKLADTLGEIKATVMTKLNPLYPSTASLHYQSMQLPVKSEEQSSHIYGKSTKADLDDV